MNEEQRALVENQARQIRRNVVDSIGCGGKVGHLGGSCSCAEILATLYFYKMKHSPAMPKDRDRFIMSKGHAVLAQYAALAQAGYFPAEELAHVKEYGSMLQGHPDLRKTPGIEANTGSLGQGLSIGLGLALGLCGTARVYVLLGDGELAEGQVWEAVMAAAHHKPKGLVAIIDANGVQASGTVAQIMDSGDIAAKFKAFGWRVLEADGHDVAALASALDAADAEAGPTAIVAHTQKGRFVSFAEGKFQFHNCALNEEQFKTAHNDIDSYQYAGRCEL